MYEGNFWLLQSTQRWYNIFLWGYEVLFSSLFINFTIFWRSQCQVATLYFNNALN